MRSFADVFDAFGGAARFAEAIGIPAFHAQTMKARGSIPARYWARVVKAAKRIDGAEWISTDALAKIAEREPARAAS